VAEVLHLFRCLAHRQPMSEVEEVSILENKGLEGCIHGRPGSGRQVLLMDVETLEEFNLAPGRVNENITTRGIAIAELQNGQHLRAGNSILEVSMPCDPCEFIEAIRPGLEQAMQGRRGVLCRVVQSGTVRRGDRLELNAQAPGV
jgi:MOSC domain-containing protein YiiM